MRFRIAASMLAIGACILPSVCHAWGETGHQVVALIASAQLTPTAKAKVDRLLAIEPGATLASISTWADEHRSPPTAPWHYVNFPRGQPCAYLAERDCPGGNCVVGAIERQVAILRSDTNAELRLRALKYLVHFFGDVHQPLHAGFGDDRGGNSYQLQAFGRGTNLHALWDSGLIGAMQIEPAVLAKELAAQPGVAAVATTFGTWAEESCRIVTEVEFYPARTLTVVEYPFNGYNTETITAKAMMAEVREQIENYQCGYYSVGQAAPERTGERRNDPRFHVGWQHVAAELERVTKRADDNFVRLHINAATKMLNAKRIRPHPKIAAVSEANSIGAEHVQDPRWQRLRQVPQPPVSRGARRDVCLARLAGHVKDHRAGWISGLSPGIGPAMAPVEPRGAGPSPQVCYQRRARLTIRLRGCSDDIIDSKRDPPLQCS